MSLHLVDTSRPDPWVPAQRARHLMVQLWYPAAEVHGHRRAPYMTPAVARAYEKASHLPVLNWPKTHAYRDAPMDGGKGGRPVVLYSHGLGGHRAEVTALLEDLAGHGYIVVAIDHVHDASVVELPDGHLERTALPELTPENELRVTTRAVNARVADTRFVLDRLAVLNRGGHPDPEHRPLPLGLRGGLDLDHIGILGHSDGGTTAAAAMHTDRRITAGINLDGTMWTKEAKAGSDRPFLMIGKENLSRADAATWVTFWKNHRGPKLQLNLAGSTHATFEDIAVLAPQAAPVLGLSPDELAKALGTIDGQRAITILRTYVNAYFDRYLRHHRDHLLDGPSARYPEMRFAS